MWRDLHCYVSKLRRYLGSETVYNTDIDALGIDDVLQPDKRFIHRGFYWRHRIHGLCNNQKSY